MNTQKLDFLRTKQFRATISIDDLSPDHSAGPDSNQLNSTGSGVELGWVLKSDHSASGDVITAV